MYFFSVQGLNTLLGILYFLTVLGISITVIIENRNPLKTSAWILIIGFIPIIGILAYIVFGQEQRKMYRINKRYYKHLLKRPSLTSLLPSKKNRAGYGVLAYSRLVQMIEANSDSPLLPIDDIEVYTSGGQYYADLMRDMEQATDHIHIEAYIFEDDSLFALLVQIFEQKSKEGIDVRIIYDFLGSYNVSKARWEELKALGVQVYSFLPVRIPLLSSTVNYRNHRKVCVIDGRIGYVGGMNFANRYQDGDALGLWRDTHFRITGPSVMALQSGFLMDWYTVSRRVVYVERFFSSYYPQPVLGDSSSLGQFIWGGPLQEQPAIEQAFASMIYQAKKSIHIQTPYFLPTETLYNALMSAILSGVDVCLMIPNRGDSYLTNLAMDSYLEPLLKVGMKIYRYDQGFIHSKVMVVDAALSLIGSANMDFRSLEHNFEVSAVIYDATLAKRLIDEFVHDTLKCRTLNLDEWAKRPMLRKVAESVMRLFAPLL